MNKSAYADIPQVERLLQHAILLEWSDVLSRPLVAEIVTEVLDGIRSEIRDGRSVDTEEAIVARVDSACRLRARGRIRKVINATGIVIHTNLGRSPLPSSVWEETEAANVGYSNLELDLETGKRGRRNGIIPELLRIVTNCEYSLIVNNNAAAVFLILSALGGGREVIVSRGEQVQIGGGFRIPEILALSGAKLVEVGTTNITTVKDYLDAVTESTALVLVVHTSNFRVRGFSKRADLRELAEALPERVVLAVDQGSGTTSNGLPGETPVHSYLDCGASLVSFSADKILGGPQAGIIVGRKDLVSVLAKHPLMRTFRPGKTIYSLLEEFLVQWLNRRVTAQAEQLWTLSKEELSTMGENILKTLPADAARIVPSEIAIGGGSVPDETFPSFSIELSSHERAEELLERLRTLPVPIIGTIEDGKVRLSLATMYGENVEYISASLRSILGA